MNNAGLGQTSIMVVDDELGYREGIRRILQGRGFRVLTAANGLEALKLAAQENFQLFLVDLKMPQMDGFELIDKLRQQNPQALCIVVSAFATIESAVQTTKMGAFDFVSKPFVPDDLLLVVNRAVEKLHLSREAELLRAEREAHLLELAAEKSRVRTILQSMGDGILVINIDGEIVLDNVASRRLLGQLEQGPLSGPMVNYLSDEKFHVELKRLLKGADKDKDLGVTLEVKLPLDNQPEPRFLRVHLTPARDGREAVCGAVVVLSDVTETKALERMKTMFVSLVAHELKSPIAAVEGYLHLIKTGALKGTPERLPDIADRCLARTGSLLSLIQDLLDITRRDAGRHEVYLERVDLAQLIAALVEFQRPEIERQELTVFTHCPAGVPAALVDRGDMERLITNLLSNAIKYNRRGGRIEVSLRQHKSTLQLEVSDTGIGISGEEQARLGEEFYRVKNGATRHITGTGLGLTLVKKICDRYHGELQIRSTPGVGSCFRVILPVPEQADQRREEVSIHEQL